MLANNERGGFQAKNDFCSRDQSGDVAEISSFFIIQPDLDIDLDIDLKLLGLSNNTLFILDYLTLFMMKAMP